MSEQESQIIVSAEEQEVKLFVWHIFEQQEDPRLVFHNDQLGLRTVDLLRNMNQRESGLPEALLHPTLVAAYFLPVGYIFDTRNPLPHAIREMRRFFAQHDYAEAERIRAVQCLQTIGRQQTPTREEEKRLHDAWQIARFLDDPEERFALLRLEEDLLGEPLPGKLDWLERQQQQLLDIRLHTHFARQHYEPVRTRYLRQVREKLHKQKNKQIDPQPLTSRPFSNLEKTEPVRATQTFFRSNYRNHINLSAIADNKANIMISVNTILLSVLIAFLSYQNIGQTKPIILLPVVIFLVTGLASLIFAVLSAKPKITMLNRHSGLTPQERRRNLVFFGNFVALDLEEYEEAMDALFRDSELLYGNMVRDLYHLGKVLEKKYRFLTVSYNIFMVGFIATVLTFLVVLFS